MKNKKSFIHRKIWPVAAGTLLVIAAAGCGNDQVKVYRVADADAVTPAPPPIAAPAAMPGSMSDAAMLAQDNSSQPTLQYTLPSGWENKALTQMRVASFGVAQDGKQADVSVIPLNGISGGDAANINRWRGQVGLASLAEEEVVKLAEKITVGELPADLYDLAGTAPGSGEEQRILAVVLHRDNTSWFFKMIGDAALVAEQKPAFIAFLKSVQFGGLAAPSTMDVSQLPPSHPPIGGMNTGLPAADTAAADQPTWEVPAGWQEGQLAQFLVAKYVIAGADGAQAAVNVSSLAGDGGGLLPNVNRWRKQLGLAPVTEAELVNLPTIDASGGKATLIEFDGTSGGKPAGLIGVVLPLGGQTWFYKLMGDTNIVAQQKEALVNFVQSAKYPHVH